MERQIHHVSTLEAWRAPDERFQEKTAEIGAGRPLQKTVMDVLEVQRKRRAIGLPDAVNSGDLGKTSKI